MAHDMNKLLEVALQQDARYHLTVKPAEFYFRRNQASEYRTADA